jgi:peptide/nickel transport system substrate-binding protein
MTVRFKALAVGLVVLAAACSSSSRPASKATTSTASTSSTSSTSEPGPLPTLKITTAIFPTSLNPSVGINDIFSFEETMDQVDDQGQPVPFLLQSLPTQTGPDAWTLQLRPHVTFENGQPMTAAAVAAAATSEVTDNPSIKTSLPGATFTATGPLTMAVTTSQPTPLLPNLLADPGLGVYDQPAAPDAGTNPQAFVGTGLFTAPYAISRYATTEMDLTAYKGYWQGTPKLAGIDVFNITDPNAEIAAVESGEMDIADDVDSPDLRHEVAGNSSVAVTTSAEPQVQYQLFLDPQSAPTNDPAVRRAIAMALDYQSLAANYTGGTSEAATGILPPGYPLLDPTQVTNVAAARSVLAADGWTPGAGGTLQRNGTDLSLKLLVYTERPLLAPLAVGVQTMLEQIGMKVSIVSEPYTKTMYSDPSSWNLTIYHYYAISATGVPDPYYAEEFGTGGAINNWHIADSHLDSLIATLTAAPNATARKTAIFALQQYIWQQAYVVDVAYAPIGALVTKQWSDYRSGNGDQQGFWNWQTAPNP